MYLDKNIDDLRMVLEWRDVRYVGNLLTNQLSLEMRLLHNMVSIIFFPKTRRLDWVTERDIAFMHYMIERKPINLLFFMLSQIKETARKI